MKISFCGITGYKDFIVGKLDMAYTIIANNDFKDSDIIYWVFGPGPDLINHFKFWFHPCKAIVIHWIGSDVEFLKARLLHGSLRKIIYYRLWTLVSKNRQKQGRLINFASAPWLVDELNSFGINAQYLPISSVKAEFLNHDIVSDQREYDFYSYLPYKSMDTYGGDMIISAAHKLSDKKFILVMKDLSQDEIDNLKLPSNITVLPKQSANDLFSIYLNTKCMLRFTRHDGLSMSVLEALSAGMQVLWSYDFPNVIQVNINDFDSLTSTMDSVSSAWQPNISGQQYIKDHFDDVSMARLYKEKLSALRI